MASRRFLKAFAAVLLVAAALVAAVHAGGVPAGRLVSRLLKPLASLTLAIGVGLLLGILIESAGLSHRLGRLTYPLLRLGRLKEPSAVAFTAAFISAVSASTILMNAYQDGTISRRELTVSALILTFPAFFSHLPSMFFIITPLVGVLGVYYILILLGADILRTTFYLLYARLSLPPAPPLPPQEARSRPGWAEIWRDTRAKFATRLFTILVITIPIYVGVFLAQEAGFFGTFRGWLARLVAGTPLPVEAVSILVFSLAAETTGGFAAAGAFLSGGSLSPGAILFTLVLGTILSSPMRAVRHQLPYYLGIYTPTLGLRLMVLSQVFRTASLLPFLAILYFWGL